MVTHSPHYFLAVPIPDEVRKILHSRTERLREKLSFTSWVHPLDYHITLVFLGKARFGEIIQLKKDIAPLVATIPPFYMTLGGSGTFGQQKSPRVFWAGVSSCQALDHIRNHMYEACEAVGFQLDQRPFHPHVTLARKWQGVTNFIETTNEMFSIEIKALSWTVNEIVLYQTHIHRSPKYQPIKVFPLKRTD